MVRFFLIGFFLIVSFLTGQSALAFDAPLADAAQEARARALMGELRCPVCQNQNIDESDAELSRDLRILVRARIEAGDDDAHIRAFLQEKYGDFILFRPRFAAHTLFLWGAPFLFLLMGLYLGFRGRRK